MNVGNRTLPGPFIFDVNLSLGLEGIKNEVPILRI